MGDFSVSSLVPSPQSPQDYCFAKTKGDSIARDLRRQELGGALRGLQEHGPQADAVDGGDAHAVDVGIEIEPHFGRFFLDDGESGFAVEV